MNITNTEFSKSEIIYVSQWLAAPKRVEYVPCTIIKLKCKSLA